jgi:nucleoside-diphosphate-sugar epimerase
MKILVLGASGYIGARLLELLRSTALGCGHGCIPANEERQQLAGDRQP